MNVNKIMKMLKKLNISLSENAVLLLINDGILSEEAPIEHYIIAKNLNEALNDKENYKRILKQNLTSIWSDKVIDVFKEG